MIQHIVVLKWKAGTTAAQVDQVLAQADVLMDGIDAVQRITVGRNSGGANHGFTHAIVVNVDGEEALATYLDHPVRRQYVTEVLSPIEEARIEIDAPTDDSSAYKRSDELSWEWGPTRHSASADAAALRWEETHPEL